jgi:nicotinamide-nucleotide amidase
MTLPSDETLVRLAARVGRHALAQGLTIATAESCTGGWIGKALTDVSGSSAWFIEGVITYSDAAKRRLGVPARVLAAQGAVSEAVVRAMARSALARSGADRAVAVSGIAGPTGAVPGKPVGTVWIGWVRRGRGRSRVIARRYHFRGDRDAVRRQSVAAALRGLLDR